MQKGGVSAVIATVLIILISVIVVAIFWVFILPIISDLSEMNQVVNLEIIQEGYTAWDSQNKLAEIQIKRGADDADIIGFDLVFVFDDGNSVRHFVNENLEENSKKTYFLNFSEFIQGELESIKIVPVFKNKKRGLPLSELKIEPSIQEDLHSIPDEKFSIPNEGIDSPRPLTKCFENCDGKECGDDGCGGNCGVCGDGESCDNGICENVLQFFEADYYVDGDIYSDCNNYNPATRSCHGGNKRAFDAIQKAADVLNPGEIVAIREGIYNERVIPSKSGTFENYITYMSYPEEKAILDGTNVYINLDQGLFHIREKSYINISGLTIRNVYNDEDKFQKTHGIRISLGNNINIEKSYIYNTCGPGIQTGGSANITISDDEFELNCNQCRGEIISLASTDTFEIKNNYVHDGGSGWINSADPYNLDGGEGIDIKEGSRNGKVYGNIIHDLNQDMGIYVDTYGLTRNIEIYNNEIYNSRDGIVVGSESGHLLEDIKVHHNIIYNNQKRGINIGGFWVEGPIPELKDIEILNNVIYGNTMEGIFSTGSNRIYTNVIIKNNILSQNSQFQMRINSPLSFIISHNLIDGTTNTTGDDYVSDDPKFVNPVSNFRLQSGSPAIDKGTNVGLTKDFDGKMIIGVPEIGAFEY
ncbi:MAG: right-handed parallel beta-helix repeat-containing protein [Candidatus Pacearchaeota archaeon]